MVSRPVEKRIYEKFQHRCVICDRETAFEEGEVDHIIPKTKGGTDNPSNLQWLCYRCNKLKGSKKTNEEVRELLCLNEKGKTLDDDIRLCFENACDSYLREPQTILTTYDKIYKSTGMGPETFLSFWGGMIVGWTLAFIFYHCGREPEGWEIKEIAKLLEGRTSEMIAIFKSTMWQ